VYSLGMAENVRQAPLRRASWGRERNALFVARGRRRSVEAMMVMVGDWAELRSEMRLQWGRRDFMILSIRTNKRPACVSMERLTVQVAQVQARASGSFFQEREVEEAGDRRKAGIGVDPVLPRYDRVIMETERGRLSIQFSLRAQEWWLALLGTHEQAW
jgi:hypothetical protein